MFGIIALRQSKSIKNMKENLKIALAGFDHIILR